MTTPAAMSIESDVLKRVKPSESEVAEIKKKAYSLEILVKDYILTHGIDAETKYVGSVAKGTFLTGPDLDLFILYPEGKPKKEMEAEVIKMGEELINGKKSYADHPYSSGNFEGLDVDLVPCYHISDTLKLLTPVDRSPFHAEYILSKVDEKMCDEIRLMKQFMKGVGTYGAEPDTRGFSGYLCELITIHYGGFLDALIAASEWKDGTTITMEKKGPLMKAPLIVYDPVDPKRNVASAVHIETFAEFIVACRSYLNSPKIEYFFPNKRKPFKREDIERLVNAHGTRLITVTFDDPMINDDNLHSQIWKTQYALVKKLDSFSFNTLRALHEIIDGKVTFIFELERDVLSKTCKRIGPPVWSKSCEPFFLKWKDNPYGRPFIEEGRWTVIGERLHCTASEMLYEEAAISGIGKDLEPDTMVIFDHDETLESSDAILLTELLYPQHRWEN